MLEKIFIKNYDKLNDKNVRSKYAIICGLFGIVTNTFLAVIKLFIGFISNSISIVADAINNLSDMISSILTVVGFKISNKQADKLHPYGHARYENIFGVLIAFIMFEFGFIFAYESIMKIITPKNLELSIYVYMVLIISIIFKFLQMNVYKRCSVKINSKALKVASIDTKNDILSTSVILIAMIVMFIFNINIDGYLGFAVSLYVIYSSSKVLIEAIEPLIGIRPSKKKVNKIKKNILKYDYVLGIHDLIIHNYGVYNDYVTVHVELDSALSLIKAHDLIDKIENDFKENMNTQITIHIDPVIIGNKKLDKLKDEIIDTIKEVNSKITIHDFRVLQSSNKKTVLFDAVIPFECDSDDEYIEKILKEKYSEYDFIIELDRPYC